MKLYLPSNSTERQRQLRKLINKKYGGKCIKCGFSDPRALHIDHINGGGTKERQGKKGTGLAFYFQVFKDESGKYQLLCANCNAIKRFEKNEARGANQHKNNIEHNNKENYHNVDEHDLPLFK